VSLETSPGHARLGRLCALAPQVQDIAKVQQAARVGAFLPVPVVAAQSSAQRSLAKWSQASRK